MPTACLLKKYVRNNKQNLKREIKNIIRSALLLTFRMKSINWKRLQLSWAFRGMKSRILQVAFLKNCLLFILLLLFTAALWFWTSEEQFQYYCFLHTHCGSKLSQYASLQPELLFLFSENFCNTHIMCLPCASINLFVCLTAFLFSATTVLI